MKKPDRTRSFTWLSGIAGMVAVAGAALFPGAPTVQSAFAKPPAPMAFCHAYPEAKACNTGFADCTACHTTPPARKVVTRASAASAPDSGHKGSEDSGKARPLRKR